MEITLCMRVMDALASQMEELKERVEMAEAHIKELQGGCSCKTWREHTGIPKNEQFTSGLVQSDTSGGCGPRPE